VNAPPLAAGAVTVIEKAWLPVLPPESVTWMVKE
jgi:hypothetical protein